MKVEPVRPAHLISVLLVSLVSSLSLVAAQPRNVILFIGDGMGFEQVKAARCYNGAPLSFEALPYQAQCTTYSADNAVTDSAAAGTAIATGVKVNNYVVSMAYPGDGSDLQTTLEISKGLGKKTGLITTTYLTHATPATFGAHAANRDYTGEIASDYLDGSLPNILFGGGGNGLTPTATQAKGYAVATDTAQFDALSTAGDYLSGQFGGTFMPYEAEFTWENYPYPHLSEMVAKALAAFENHPAGFFLMVEGGMIDQAGHDNHLARNIHETLELSRAVQVAMNWALGRTDTLVLVTADHETGGLTVTADKVSGVYPEVTWSTTGHTAANVPVYAWGVDAARVTGILDNTDIHRLCTGKPIPVTVPLISTGALWKYDATGTDLGTTWRGAGYVDSSWLSGPSQLGYGDGDEATIIPKTSPVYSCYYFRHHFAIDNPAAYEALSLRILRDDGAVVYLNGTEVARYNMPAGDISFGTWASTAIDLSWDAAVGIPNLLVPGENVLAVEIHQANGTSTDISLDLNLTAVRTEPDTTPPVISGVGVSFTDTTALVSWTTDEPADSWIDYGLAESALTSRAGNSTRVTTHSVQLSGLSANTTYYYRVSSTDSWGNTAGTGVASFTTQPFINDPPTVPVLTAIPGNNVVSLSWSASIDPDGGDVLYDLYRRLAEESYALVAQGLSTTTYDDLKTVNGTTYYYTVRARDAQSEPSLYVDSNEASATPAPPDYNAYVVQNPTLVSGTVTGADFGALKTAGDNKVQTLTEAKIGLVGQLEAQYLLQTIAAPDQIISLELVLNVNMVSTPDDNAWNVMALNGSAWDLVGTLASGDTAVRIPLDPLRYLSGGFIKLAITDGADIKKEKLDSLSIDQLYIQISTGLKPTAENDFYTVAEDVSLAIAAPGVLANDINPEASGLSAELVTGPAHGTLTLNADGSFTYTPAVNFNGTDTFTYKADNVKAESLPATVTITVTAVNDSPIAADDAYAVVQGTTLTIAAPGVLANDTDPDGDPLLPAVVSSPAQGTLTLNADGSFTYTPAAGFIGQDSFTYTVSDGVLSSAPATVALTVAAPSPKVHVASIDMAKVVAGKNIKGTATVKILYADGTPAAGATVSGDWLFGTSSIGTVSGLTDASGIAVLSSAPVRATSGSFTFTVKDVTLTGATYDSAANVETFDTISF